MADSFTLADLATFEKEFKPAATAAPTGDTGSEQPQPTTSELETQTADSPAADTALGDNVDESSSVDTTTADASDESEPVVEPDDDNVDQKPVKPKGRAQERIAGLVADNKALKASLDYLQNQVLAKLPQPTQTETVSTAPASEAAPTLESCGFDTAKWTEEMNSWTNKQIEAGVKRAVQTVKHEQTVEARVQGFQSREAAFAAKTPDYGVVIGNPALPRLSPEPAQLVLDSPVGPQILYHLGLDPVKAARISRMTPVQQAAAIGRLETELSAAKPAAQKTPSNNITRAPNPPTPTSGRGNTPSVDPSKMSAKDWIEWDRQQTVAKRRAAKAARTG